MPQEITLKDGKRAPVPNVFGTKGELYGATITVGAETGGTTINVVVQLTDFLGDDLTTSAGVFAYLSDNADGSTIGTAHSTSPAIGTDGLMLTLVTDLVFMLVSESDGDIDINFVDSGAQTVYLVLVMPDGRLVISGAITHAA